MRWFSYEQRYESGFDDEAFHTCYVGKIFHFLEQRSAWHGYRSSRYPSIDGFAEQFVEVQRRIEDDRKQGSKWLIVELPVLVLEGQDDCLLLGEINTRKPLADFDAPIGLQLTLDHVGAHFEPKKDDSVFRIVCDKGVVRPATFPFFQHESSSRGPAYSLDWTPRRSGMDLTSVLGAMCAIVLQLGRK